MLQQMFLQHVPLCGPTFKPKDTVTLGYVGHKSNLTGRERLAPQSKNLFSDWEKGKKLV